ncbi:MAG: hypothetical protein HY821_08760, partial [Acidobacteria bacterium]|nr:hypothetical protein [Acidobacteriota bacterium]
AGFLAQNNRVSAGQEPGCFNCHADKRGPFVYEHAPVKNESCAICHEVHGSGNPRMMKRSEVANLCLECHSNIQSPPKGAAIGGIPPAFHDMRSPRWRNCTICHQKVHGSNADKSLTR